MTLADKEERGLAHWLTQGCIERSTVYKLPFCQFYKYKISEMLDEINQCKILLNLNDSGQCEGSVRNSLVSLVRALLKHKSFYLSFECDGFAVVFEPLRNHNIEQ